MLNYGKPVSMPYKILPMVWRLCGYCVEVTVISVAVSTVIVSQQPFYIHSLLGIAPKARCSKSYSVNWLGMATVVAVLVIHYRALEYGI